MERPGRNDPCYCGSGKKYKKCCLQRDDSTEKAFSDMMGPSDFKPAIPKDNGKDLNWLKDYDQLDLLQALAYIQVLPPNHGKNLRLEILITEIVNKGKRNNSFFNVDALCQKLRQHLIKHSFEDPPEEFATENISFHDGNFVVYPGIFSNGTDMIQGHLFTLANHARMLPPTFVWSVSMGVMFILTIHDRIARALGQSHRLFEETETDAIHLPPEDLLISGTPHFFFSNTQIEEICAALKIDPKIIERFTYTHKQTIRFDDMDSNPLFARPFIRFDDGYVLVLPTSEIGCLNDLIIAEAKAHNCLPQFIECFASEAESDIDLLLRGMGWTELEPDLPAITVSDSEIQLNQQLFRFDLNKVAYVVTFNEVPLKYNKKVADFTQRSKMVVTNIRASLAYLREKMPGKEILLLTIINKSDTLSPFYLEMEKFQQADRQFNTTLPELTVMTAQWPFDHLTLWKFVKALDASEPHLDFAPYASNLAKYEWYDKNHGSFFQSDDAQVNYLVFDFSIDGIIKREAKAKMDRITIPFFAEGRSIYVRCRRKEQHYPVYFSDEVKVGFFRYALLKYECPVWIQSNTRRNQIADVYQNALFYWLHEAHNQFRKLIDRFGKDPVTISLVMDSKFENMENWNIAMSDDGPEFNYEFLAEHRAVEMTVPVNIVPYLRGADNSGEGLLMGAVLRGFNQLLVVIGREACNEKEITEMVGRAMPPSRKKMIVISEATEDPELAPVGPLEPRTIQETDISTILHQQLDWLPGKPLIPEKVEGKKVKTDLLNALVGVHFNKLIDQIRKFDGLKLIRYLMNRNEALIHERARRQINIPVEDACYGQFYDVFERFKKSEGKLVSSSLAIRSLIEFVACEMPDGDHPVNDDDIDLMMAHMNELISYGSLSDLINFEINDPEMGLLPSGRLGIDHAFEEVTIEGFRMDVYKDDFARFSRNFDRNFKTKQEAREEFDDDVNRYWDRVDAVFEKEWGTTLWNLAGACNFISNSMVADGVAVALLNFKDLHRLLAKGNSKTETQKLIDVLAFNKRQGVLNVPKKELHETYPWRFNRRIAYISKPMIPIEKEGVTYYLISARHLHIASQNIVARFFNGTLKVKQSDLGIQNLLAERNDIKGKQFRDAIANWLKTNTKLTVLDHEAKIKPKGFFDADNDKGDVDVLAIDHERKIIFAIECKNTTQAKIAYDIYSEIVNYLGLKDKEGMIAKHIRRDEWLKQNHQQVHERLGLSENYAIQSFVLTKNILPTKYIRETQMDMFAYADLLGGKTPIVLIVAEL
jgi:hypothetical protein